MGAQLPWSYSVWLRIAVVAAGLPWVQSGAPPSPRVLTIGAVQYAPTSAASEDLTKLQSLIAQAARNGATAVVLPEHALMGPFPVTQEPQPSKGWEMPWGRNERVLAGLAKENAIWLIVSASERLAGHKHPVINSVVFDDTGRIMRRQAKLQPHRDWGDGDATKGDSRLLSSLDFPGGRLGVTSGDDIEQTIPRLSILGAETIFVSASWQPADITHWRDVARELATRHHVNLAIANLASTDTPKELWSAVIGKDGSVVAEAKAPENEAVVGSVVVRPQQHNPVLGLPTVPHPARSTPSAEDIELGRKLFFDGNLSNDGKTSCGVCHDPDHAFADGKRLAAGVYGRTGHRNSPSLLNAAYKTFFGWDGMADTMELQTQHALLGWAEMNHTVDWVTDYVDRSPEYAAYRANGRIEAGRLFGCISAYVRTLVSGDSPFDRYYFAGDGKAISASATRGLSLFRNKAKCASCHEIQPTYALFSDNAFHNTGVGFHKRFEYLGYSGDGIEGNMATKNRFRGEYITPSLRNIALTAPYMHDGSLPTLEEVVAFYNRGGNPNPFLDSRLTPLHLTARERADLVAFLRTLNGAPVEKKLLPNTKLHSSNRRQ